MIICVGEILADLIGREHDGIFSYDRFAGGAPFNVACGLKKLGAACGFYGSVGDDLVGDFLISFAERQNFDFLEIRKDNERNTTLAFVELDKGGERRFSFYRKNTADYILQSAAAEKIAKIADIVHIGSVPLSKEEGRAFADEQILRARAHGKKVSFDVNYREDLFESAAEAAGVYRKRGYRQVFRRRVDALLSRIDAGRGAFKSVRWRKDGLFDAGRQGKRCGVAGRDRARGNAARAARRYNGRGRRLLGGRPCADGLRTVLCVYGAISQ